MLSSKIRTKCARYNWCYLCIYMRCISWEKVEDPFLKDSKIYSRNFSKSSCYVSYPNKILTKVGCLSQVVDLASNGLKLPWSLVGCTAFQSVCSRLVDFHSIKICASIVSFLELQSYFELINFTTCHWPNKVPCCAIEFSSLRIPVKSSTKTCSGFPCYSYLRTIFDKCVMIIFQCDTTKSLHNRHCF